MKDDAPAQFDDSFGSLRRRVERVLSQLEAKSGSGGVSMAENLLEELTLLEQQLEAQGRDLPEEGKQLRQPPKLFFEQFASAPIPIFFFQRDGCITEMNLQAAALLENRPRQPFPLPVSFFEELLIPAQVSGFRTFLAACFCGEGVGHEAEQIVLVTLRADNRSRTFQLTGRLMGKGEEERLAVYLQDVTQISAQKAELFRLSLIAENTRNGVLCTDTEQRVTYANKAFSDMTGYSFAEIVGKNPRFLQGGATDRATVERIRGALLQREGFHETILNYRKDGRCYWVDIECLPVWESGQLTGFMALQTDVTERVERELALKNFHTAIEQSPLMVMITDASGKIEFVNPAFENVTQYSAAEVVGKNPRILKSGTQEDSFYQDLWAIISSGEIWRGTLQNRRKDGSLYWESASIAPVLDENGQISRFIAIKEDITTSHLAQEERRQTFAELEKTKEFLEQTEQVARVGGWEVSIQTGEIYHSRMTSEIHGLPQGYELSFEEGINFYREGEDRERIRKAATDCLERGTPFDVECRFVNRRGREIWVHVIGQPRRLDGEIVGIYGTFQDIDEQKRLRQQVEETLVEKNKQLRFIQDLTDALPVGIFTKDLLGRYSQCNPAFLQMHGLKREEVIGRTSAQVFGFEQGKAMHRDDLQLLKDDAPPQQIETKVINSKQAVMATKAVFHDEKGKVAGLVGALTDISQIKELEASLRQAKMEADSSNRAKSIFLATMSHEIRTPLNAVIGMASLLEEMTFDARQREYAHTIVTASETLLALINDILDYSKIESRRMELHTEEFVFEDCFLEPVEWFSREAIQKNIEVVHYLDPALPKVVQGDKLRLRQILMNLLSNAVKFTPSGQVSVEVRLGRPDPALTSVHGRKQIAFQFAVRDTGIGIDTEAQKHLFQPFSQADSSVTRQYGGSGLGLAITHHLVEIMGGTIELQSEPGTGTSFFFTLPFVEADARSRPKAPEPKLRGRRLLVVDDVAVNCELLEAFGGKWGMEVRSARGPAEGRRILEEGYQPDFIILDYQMPVEDGATMARSLRGIPRFQKIPRILLSSIVEPSEIFEEGLFQLVLHKPLRPSKLKTHLLRLLESSSSSMTSGRGLRALAAASNKVLIAEDNPNNQTVLKLMMTRLGCRFTIVENGAEAVEAATKENFDIVLLDVQMPVMDGLTAARKLRELFADRPTRPYLVSLTANAFVEDQKDCLAAGFDFYISKPVTLGQLEDVFIRRPMGEV